LSLLRVAVTLEQCWHRVPGGTASSALGTVDNLRDRDDIECIGVAACHHSTPPAPWTPSIETRHMRLRREVLYESWHRFRWPSIERVTGRVDVIHATGMAIPPKSAPLAVTVHDLAFVDHPEHATRHGLRFFHRSLVLTERDADVVLCPSVATKNELIALGIGEQRIRVVPWGVEPFVVTDDDIARVRARHGVMGRYVLWVGTIEPRKNLGAVIAAFRALPDADLTLLLVGPHGWNEDLAARLGGDDRRIHALGFVPREELLALYAGAAAFCYPSLREGFGIPVLEAMMAGAPVVTSSGTATEEVVGDAGICVDPLDHAAIANALASILGDEEATRQLRVRAKARAGTFTWARTADLTVEAYRAIAR
jgi:glycosyltransferase involved in cell wall biosynthesis